MSFPDFFILGAPKGGTHTLTAWLRERDDVFLLDSCLENYHATDLRDRLCDEDQYVRAFQDKGNRIRGEMSDWYLYSDDAVPNILKSKPDARFIVCLHDPAEIAWALHSDYLSNRIEHVRNFNTAWAMSHARSQGRGVKRTDDPKLLDYASVCALGRQVARLLSRVPNKNVHFVFLEDLTSSPAEAWASLENFLNLPHQPRKSWPIEDFVIRRPLVSLHEAMLFARRMKRRFFPKHGGALRLGAYINGLNRRPGVLKPLPDMTRQKISDRMSEDVATLSVLTNKDLTHWLA